MFLLMYVQIVLRTYRCDREILADSRCNGSNSARVKR